MFLKKCFPHNTPQSVKCANWGHFAPSTTDLSIDSLETGHFATKDLFLVQSFQQFRLCIRHTSGPQLLSWRAYGSSIFHKQSIGGFAPWFLHQAYEVRGRDISGGQHHSSPLCSLPGNVGYRLHSQET